MYHDHHTSNVSFLDKTSQLFGEDEDSSGELDDAEKQGENGMPSLRPCIDQSLTRH